MKSTYVRHSVRTRGSAISVCIAFVFIHGCGGSSQPMSDAAVNDTVMLLSDASHEANSSVCPGGVVHHGQCNAVTNDGCHADETCEVFRDLNGVITTSCSVAGPGVTGSSCDNTTDCSSSFGCFGGTCQRFCCGTGDDATCRTGPGSSPTAVCLTEITGTTIMLCGEPPPNEDSGSGCDSDRANCGGFCVLLNDDPQNCGACGHQCGNNEACTDGLCCPDLIGETRCGATCVNTRNDAANCGRCGHACGVHEVCRHDGGGQPGDGECTNVSAPCASDGDCTDPAGLRLACRPVSLGFPGGQCGGTNFQQCDYNLDCRSGYVCQQGLCRPECSTNASLLCGQNACHADVNLCGVPGTEGFSVDTGGCFVDSDCSLGSTCTGPERSNLTRTCECTAQTDCGAGRGCFPGSIYGSICGCASDAVCGPGHHCGTDHVCAFGALE